MNTYAYKTIVIVAVTLSCLSVAQNAPAAEIQHLDASISASVLTNSLGVVTSWTSGVGNNATPLDGSVTYPSTNLVNGLKALRFGSTNQTSLQLFSNTGSDSWLKQTTNTNGFSVLVAFRASPTTPSYSDILGNTSDIKGTGFFLRLEDGAPRVTIGGQSFTKTGANAVPGDAVIWAFNYNNKAGQGEFWDSESYSSSIYTVPAGDFSMGNPVRVGCALPGNGRYLNGEIGEVRIYNTALSTTDFKKVRQDMAFKWAGISPPVEINWRVIDLDTNYPSDDVIVAALSVDDPVFTYPLPADPTNQDCSATFQEAIDSVAAAGGGTVFVPAGQYRFDTNLTVGAKVTLRGRWKAPSASQPVTGTILKVYANRNNATNTPFISLSAAAGLRDLAIWHPEQTPTNIVPYPYAVATAGTVVTLENITMVNAYQGFDLRNAAYLCTRNLFGSPLYLGYITDHGSSVPRYDGINFSPNYWAWSGLPGSPAVGGAHATFMRSQGIGCRVLELDSGFFAFSHISGYSIGMQYERGASTDNAGEQAMRSVVIDNCGTALKIVSCKTIRATDCSFSGTTYGMHHITDFADDFLFAGCTFSGGTAAIYDASWALNLDHGFSLQNCTVNGPINIAKNGFLSVVASQFTRTGTDVVLNSGVSSAIISGCTFADGPNIINNSGAVAGKIQIDHTPVASYPLPPFETNYVKVRKPDKTTLFNITATNFAGGAKGDGVTDDTAAIQAAILAAKQNDGGIVLVPFGTYVVKAPLDLGAGVELRGNYGGRHTPLTMGSLFLIKTGQGTNAGPAFLTLGDRSGVRGMTFHYPVQSQDETGVIPYPFMIRCQGLRNYLIDNAATDPYQTVDLNGANEHLIEYSFLGALKTAYQVGGGSRDGRIQNLHVKWSFWRDSGLDYPSTNNKDIGERTAAAMLETFVINDCTNETLFSIFNHAAHTLFTQNGGSGIAVLFAAELVQRGFVFNTAPASGTFEFMNCAGNVCADGDGTGIRSFWLRPGYTGDVIFHTTYHRSDPDDLFRVDSGRLVMQQATIDSGGTRGLYDIRTGGTGLVMDNIIVDSEFDLDVSSGSTFTARHCLFKASYQNSAVSGYADYHHDVFNGTMIAADINGNPARFVGINMKTNNVAAIKVETFPSSVSTRDPIPRQCTGWHLVSSNSVLFNVTDLDFTNGTAPTITFSFTFLEDTDGTNSFYYKSTTGEKLLGTYVMSASTADWTTKTYSNIKDARFSATNSADIRVEVSGAGADPVFNAVMVESAYLGEHPSDRSPQNLTAAVGGKQILLDWADNSEPDLASYRVYRSTTNGGPYTVRATNVLVSSYTDTNVTAGISYYYVVTAVDTSKLESGYSSQASAAVLLAPVAGFSGTPTSGARPLPVTFTDQSTGSITNLLWSFGDGQTTNTAAGTVLSHIYATNGTYTVSLIASGLGGSGTNTQTGRVTVLIPNPPQIVGFHPDGAGALVLEGTGGPTNGVYYYWVRSATNLFIPLTNWSIVSTNLFAADGSFSNALPNTPGIPQQFYRLQLP